MLAAADRDFPSACRHGPQRDFTHRHGFELFGTWSKVLREFVGEAGRNGEDTPSLRPELLCVPLLVGSFYGDFKGKGKEELSLPKFMHTVTNARIWSCTSWPTDGPAFSSTLKFSQAPN